MKLKLKTGEIIPFDNVTILDDNNEPLYSLHHFVGKDYFQVIKLRGVMEDIDYDKEFLKSDNVIIVK